MSTEIILKLPFIDQECLKKAIETCGCQFHETGENQNHCIKLSNGIEFLYSSIGYKARIDQGQQEKVKKIYQEYQWIYENKKKRIKEQKQVLSMLDNVKQQQYLKEEKEFQQERDQTIKNMINKIETKAKLRGYKVKKVETEDETVQLVLVRRA